MSKTGSKGGGGTFAVILVSALLVIAVFTISQLEVYEQVTRERVSAELRSNNFYILGRWLSESGHPVRFSPRWAGIEDLSPREGGLFLMASLLDWEKDGESLVPWVQEGGSLIISVDSAWYWRMSGALDTSANLKALEVFLKNLGLILRVPELGNEDETLEDEAGIDGINGMDETGAPEAGEDSETAAGSEAVVGSEASANSETAGDNGVAAGAEAEDGMVEDEYSFPYYDWTIGLELAEDSWPDKEPLILLDEWENIRLIRMPLGQGSLTVTGSCYFMYNYNLDIDADARLSWELTGASLGAERPGMLFVRGRQAAGGLFAALRERGNLLPPLVSIAVLVLVGFWTVIPGFGPRREEEAVDRAAITGRFTAEARFLHRYGAYGAYLEAYLQELRRRSGGREPGREVKEVEAVLASGKKISQRKMAAYLKNLMSALEQV